LGHIQGKSAPVSLVVLLLLASPSFLPFVAGMPGVQPLASDHALATVPAAPYTGTSGTITLNVNGANFAAKNVTADKYRNSNFIFLMDAGASVSISVTAPANPYKSAVTTSRLEIDQVTGSKQATGSNGQLTASGTFDHSLDYHSLGDITINVRFDCFVNCPAPDAFAQRILLDFVIRPTVTIQSNASSVSIPGSIKLQGDVVPSQQYVNLYTLKDGAVQKWLDYNYEPLSPDANGHFQITANFTKPSQGGNYMFIANATSNHPLAVSDSAVTAQASVNVTVGSSSVTTTKALPPVIFIPGVAGTTLKDGGSQVWPLAITTSMLDLALNKDGATPAKAGTQITTGDILNGFPANFYGGFIAYLEKMGYIQDQNVFTFPYDWRLDNLQQLPALDNLVNRASSSNENAKVVLIAHSMGGLIATAYVLSSHSRAAKISSIVSMGTPYWGSPKVYYGVISGYTFGNPDASQLVMKDIIQNMPAAYELLPRDNTFVYDTSGPTISLGQTYAISYKATGPFTTDQNTLQMNPGLLQAKAKFDAMIGPKASPNPLGVKQYVIIGTGVETVSYFSERAPNPGESYLFLGQNVVLDPHFGDGDGTVPIWGAETSTATSTYYVSYENRFGFGTSLRDVSSEHGALPANTNVQQIVGQILQGSPPPASSHPYALSTGKEADYTEFELHSNANMTVVDSATGGSMGYNKNGGIGENVSQGTFMSIGGVEYAAVQNISRSYHVNVQGTSTGKFTLSLNITRGGSVISSFAYPNVPVTSNTGADLTLSEGNLQSPPALTVSNGGGNKTTISPVVASFTPMKSTAPIAVPGSITNLVQPLARATGVGVNTLFIAFAAVIFAIVVAIGVKVSRRK
jgi:hypothetical protein